MTVLTDLRAVADTSSDVAMPPDCVRSPAPGATRMETDELAGIVAAVCARFPGSPRSDVETLVEDAFRHLKAGATVTAHLIPLTLNRSLRLMHESVATSSRETVATRCPVLSQRTG
ncbi:three-helix bundle dimerization domain-containing protein [Mycobacterium antarcticum]|uniref:three-helix bundle dimerization domain-containing protein n=1 Tax=Mycolicibacterium sp. TUM20984 TaxID=3023368 RepID=UPI0023899386|nr:hypothetical protein [Mycolicibacterium sp. TUM20984]GLP82772.1 hypothetical protein TUM20984_41920 [Mycolicibacterium sp. TUM20984]